MTVVINGTSGITDVNGTAAAPAITGTDTDTGVFFGTNTVSLSTGGTERVTLDASGNLGIGTTSPSYPLDVVANSSAWTVNLRGRSADNLGYLRFSSNNGATTYAAIGTPATNTLGFDIAGSERARIDSSGNFGIGATSMTNVSNYKFVVTNAATGGGLVCQQAGTDKFAVYNAGNDGYYDVTSNHIFRTGGAISGTERARINSSGNLLVGTTTDAAAGAGSITVYNSANNSNTLFVRSTSSTYNGEIFLIGCDRNTTNGSFNAMSYYNYGAGAYKFKMLDSGNLQNANNSYGALSDIKLKENITDATPKLEKLNQVRVVNYNFIGDTQKQIGVIAQELEQIFPGMVEETPDVELVKTTDEEGNETVERVDLGTTTKAVKYSVFVPMLIKAIQEQQAIITQLQADVQALKGNA